MSAAASWLLAAWLLLCTVSVHSENVKVLMSAAKADAALVEAWYQVPLDAQPTDRIALYPQETSDVSSVDPIRYAFVPSSLAAANSRAAAQ